MPLHPLIESLLPRIPSGRNWKDIRECPICRTSDAATQAGSRYCETCLTDGSADANETVNDGRWE